MGRAIEMTAILKQGHYNRIILYGQDGRELGSLPPENFAECYGQDQLEKIWKERRIEIVETVAA